MRDVPRQFVGGPENGQVIVVDRDSISVTLPADKRGQWHWYCIFDDDMHYQFTGETFEIGIGACEPRRFKESPHDDR